jgi:hypothetical protein
MVSVLVKAIEEPSMILYFSDQGAFAFHPFPFCFRLPRLGSLEFGTWNLLGTWCLGF